jgi:hypothetical protein
MVMAYSYLDPGEVFRINDLVSFKPFGMMMIGHPDPSGPCWPA